MAEQKESSVLFSLKELMSLEEDRLKQEETERNRAAEREMNAKLEAERRAREEEEARIRAEDERRRNEEQRAREEAARLEALRHAEIEKARVEAENRARMEALKAQQEHERQIAAISQEQGKKKATMIAGGTAVLLVAALVGGGLYFKNVSDEAARDKARLEQEVELAKAETEKLKRELKEGEDNITGLRASLTAAKSDAEKKALEDKIAAAQREQEDRRERLGNVRRPASTGKGSTSPTKSTTKCAEGDPLCVP